MSAARAPTPGHAPPAGSAPPDGSRPFLVRVAPGHELGAVALSGADPCLEPSFGAAHSTASERRPERPPYLVPRCHVTEVHKLAEESFAELVGRLSSQSAQVAGGCAVGQARPRDGQLQARRGVRGCGRARCWGAGAGVSPGRDPVPPQAPSAVGTSVLPLATETTRAPTSSQAPGFRQ